MSNFRITEENALIYVQERLQGWILNSWINISWKSHFIGQFGAQSSARLHHTELEVTKYRKTWELIDYIFLIRW